MYGEIEVFVYRQEKGHFSERKRGSGDCVDDRNGTLCICISSCGATDCVDYRLSHASPGHGAAPFIL